MGPDDESPTYLRTKADSKNLSHASSVGGGQYRFSKRCRLWGWEKNKLPICFCSTGVKSV